MEVDPHRGWVSGLNKTEEKWLRESEAWLRKEPSWLSKGARVIERPIEWLHSKIPAAIQQQAQKVVSTSLLNIWKFSKSQVKTRFILDMLCEKVGKELTVYDRAPWHSVDIEAIESLVEKRQSHYYRLGLAEGAGTGALGFTGFLLDIPGLYFLLFSHLQEIATLYGIDVLDIEEREYLFKILDAGHYVERYERRKEIEELFYYHRDEELEDKVDSKRALEDMERTVGAKLVQASAAKLTQLLVRRKALQSVSVVGGAIGALVNAQLIRDVGTTARHCYRQRLLRERGKHRKSRVSPRTQKS